MPLAWTTKNSPGAPRPGPSVARWLWFGAAGIALLLVIAAQDAPDGSEAMARRAPVSSARFQAPATRPKRRATRPKRRATRPKRRATRAKALPPKVRKYRSQLLRHRPRQRRRYRHLFSFAVISDTHDYSACAARQGLALQDAVQAINRLRPAFVVGLGDLVAGGGDCKKLIAKRARAATTKRPPLSGGPRSPAAPRKVSTKPVKRNGPVIAGVDVQLAELKRVLLDPLKVPFVPVSGNHDFKSGQSKNPSQALRSWARFWKANKKSVLPGARQGAAGGLYRFKHRGVGFTMLGYTGTLGPAAGELAWIRRKLRRNDLVFRHVNPYGISCISKKSCGCAMRSRGTRRQHEALTRLLRAKRARLLFAGHTHAFFDAICKHRRYGPLRFVNTGALGIRAMEYLNGWKRTAYHRRRAFVWVDVDRGPRNHLGIRVTFLLYNAARRRFRSFNKRHFPRVVTSKRRLLKGTTNVYEGIGANCYRVTRW